MWWIFTVLFIVALFLEAWYDWKARGDIDFVTERLRKVAKAFFLTVLFAGGCYLQWKGFIYYVVLRILLFSFFFYSLRFGRIFLDLEFYWKHSELHYWYLILTGRKAWDEPAS